MPQRFPSDTTLYSICSPFSLTILPHLPSSPATNFLASARLFPTVASTSCTLLALKLGLATRGPGGSKP